MFEDIFQGKKLNRAKLGKYGFTRVGNSYCFEQEVMDHRFRLLVTVGEQGIPETKLIEPETDCEYTLYQTSAQGVFVGKVREEIGKVLSRIADACYERANFQTRQSQMLIRFVRKTYGDELEFLWDKFPNNAIWRRKDNQKWYGAILTVQGKKLGLPTSAILEIIDLRLQPERMAEQIAQENYYPGWHMNKKSWYNMVFDGGISDQELCKRVSDSYELAKK